MAHVAQHEAFLYGRGGGCEEVGGGEDSLPAGIAYPAESTEEDGEAVGEIAALAALEPERQGRE